jgi:hypothetical protein
VAEPCVNLKFRKLALLSARVAPVPGIQLGRFSRVFQMSAWISAELSGLGSIGPLRTFQLINLNVKWGPGYALWTQRCWVSGVDRVTLRHMFWHVPIWRTRKRTRGVDGRCLAPKPSRITAHHWEMLLLTLNGIYCITIYLVRVVTSPLICLVPLRLLCCFATFFTMSDSKREFLNHESERTRWMCSVNERNVGQFLPLLSLRPRVLAPTEEKKIHIRRGQLHIAR